MSKYIHTTYKKATRMQSIVCGFLFSAFSFVYLYVFQRDVLEALHYSLAQERTRFAPLASAFIITLVLVLLGWGINVLFRLKGGLRAFSYFPSCLVLGALTDVGKTVYMPDRHSPWIWLLPLLLLAYAILVYVVARISGNRVGKSVNPVRQMNSNLLIFVACCLMTVSIGNTNRNFHHELQAERFLRERRFGEALKVGGSSLETTRTLTALRAIAMSRLGMLGEKLFEYPQYYRSEGLFFADDSLQTLRYTNDSVYYLLGVRPYAGEDRLVFLHNICYKGTGKYTALDYYLCALLLEKRLDTFGQAMVDLCETDESLPRYYREAILMLRESRPEYPFQVEDSTMIRRYADYRDRKGSFSSPKEEENRMRREYGDTYWWYFDYQK